MRQILVDHARNRHAAKRRGGKHAIPLDEATAISDRRMTDIIGLDDALTDLAKLNVRQSEIVELKYFGGLTLKKRHKF